MSQELLGANELPSPLPGGLLLQTQSDDPPESVGGGPKQPTTPQDLPLDPVGAPPAPEDVTGYAENPQTSADDPPESVGGGPA